MTARPARLPKTSLTSSVIRYGRSPEPFTLLSAEQFHHALAQFRSSQSARPAARHGRDRVVPSAGSRAVQGYDQRHAAEREPQSARIQFQDDGTDDERQDDRRRGQGPRRDGYSL